MLINNKIHVNLVPIPPGPLKTPDPTDSGGDKFTKEGLIP